MIHSTKTFYFLFLTRWEGKQGNVGEDILASAEESAMANFDFLSREEDLEDEDEVSWVWGVKLACTQLNSLNNFPSKIFKEWNLGMFLKQGKTKENGEIIL